MSELYEALKNQELGEWSSVEFIGYPIKPRVGVIVCKTSGQQIDVHEFPDGSEFLLNGTGDMVFNFRDFQWAAESHKLKETGWFVTI